MKAGRATLKATEKFLDLSSMSGQRLAYFDPRSGHFTLPPDITDEALGAAILRVLSGSKQTATADLDELRGESARAYEAWVLELCAEFKYSSRRQLFRRMKCLNIELEPETIILKPTRRDGSEGWSGLGQEHNIAVLAAAPDEEIGRAARLALERST